MEKIKGKIQFLPRRGEFKSLMAELEKLGTQCSIIQCDYSYNITAISKIVRSIKGDIFVTANPYYGLFAAILAKKFGKIKYSIFRPVGDYQTENDFRYGKINYRIRCLLKMLENSFSLRDVDFTLAVSNWLRKKLERYGLKNVYTLYNGVDCIRFKPRETDERYRTQILCIMNFDIYKKLEPLYMFLTEYKKSKLPYHITFLGDGFYLDSLKKDTLKLGLDKKVTFKGWVENIEYYYSNCDILVHPSGLDAFPSAILEAGASAKPVVATNVGGIPEIIIDGKTGFITNNLNDFSNYVEKLMENSELSEKMGIRARKRIVDKFTWEKTAARFYDILKKENIKV